MHLKMPKSDIALRTLAVEIHEILLRILQKQARENPNASSPPVPTFTRPLDPKTTLNAQNVVAIIAPLFPYQPLMQASAEALETAMERMRDVKRMRKSISDERKDHGRSLARVIRQFCQSYSARVDRMGYPQADKLWLKDVKPFPSSANNYKWVHIGRDIIDAEEDSVERGRPPMVNPSIDELKTELALFEEAANAGRRLEQDATTANLLLRKARQDCSELLQELADYIRFIYSKFSPTVRRQIMRILGFKFASPKGSAEAVDLLTILPEMSDRPGAPSSTLAMPESPE